MFFADPAERSYLIRWLYVPIRGDTTGPTYNAAIGTYYSIVPGLSWWAVGLKPYVDAEIRMMPSSYRAAVVSLGYRLGYERFVATNGYTDDYWNPTYTEWRRYGFITLITGMPYLTVGSRWMPDPFSRFCFYAGLKHVITKRVSRLASGSTFIFRNPAVSFGFSADVCSWHTR
jgi:hypothetical protein